MGQAWHQGAGCNFSPLALLLPGKNKDQGKIELTVCGRGTFRLSRPQFVQAKA